MTDPFDIPLFRELQRLLASSEGPINLEIARQTAGALALQGTAETPPGGAETASLTEEAYRAHALVTGYSRLAAAEPPQAEAIGRSQWITLTLEGWRWLLERLAERFGGELGALMPEAEGTAGPLAAGMGQVIPLMMGVQAGMLVGHLAPEALGRFDVPVPRDDDGRLFFVTPNLAQVATSYDLDLAALRTWLVLHSVIRGAVLGASPWIDRYWRSLLVEVTDALEIDPSDLESRLIEMGSGDLGALRSEQIVPVVQTERYGRALERLRSFLALFEGYANHVAAVVGDQLLDAPARVDEAMARREASPGEGRRFLSSLLGVSVDRSLERSGTTFCAAVVRLNGVAALNRVWEAPDNLPTLDEIKDPFKWIERVLADG